MEMEEAGSSSSPDDAVLFFGVSLVLGIGSRHLLRGTRVPYTVALLVLGVALGRLEYGTKHGLGKLGAGIRILTFMGLKCPAAGAGTGGSHGRPASA